jgi:uncharacterized membrane protein
MTVHFPIAFYLLGVLLTLIYLWRENEEVEQFAYWSFILGFIGTIVASVVGLIDQNQLELNDPRRVTVNNHITASVALLIINGLLIYMRFRWQDVLSGKYRWAYLGLLMSGVVAVLATAWLGGELVFQLQVGIR